MSTRTITPTIDALKKVRSSNASEFDCQAVPREPRAARQPNSHTSVTVAESIQPTVTISAARLSSGKSGSRVGDVRLFKVGAAEPAPIFQAWM